MLFHIKLETTRYVKYYRYLQQTVTLYIKAEINIIIKTKAATPTALHTAKNLTAIRMKNGGDDFAVRSVILFYS